MISPRLAVAAFLLACAGCSGGTTLLLVVDASAVPGAQQIHVVGRAGDDLAFGPAVRPEQAGAPLEGPQTLRVLLRDDLAQRRIEVVVEALVGGAAKGSARTSTIPQRGDEVRVELKLAPHPPECVDCDGCCDDEGRCLEPSVAACGAGGVSCFECAGQVADRCTSEGRCGCGDGPACDGLLGADRCAGGQCQCGEGAACEAGQECFNGLCRCTPDACAGCCLGNDCRPGNASSACGSGGGACVACDVAMVCSAGSCVPS